MNRNLKKLLTLVLSLAIILGAFLFSGKESLAAGGQVLSNSASVEKKV